MRYQNETPLRENIMTYIDYVQEGYEAYKSRLGRSENPYEDSYDEDFSGWLEGWYQAKDDEESGKLTLGMWV